MCDQNFEPDNVQLQNRKISIRWFGDAKDEYFVYVSVSVDLRDQSPFS